MFKSKTESQTKRIKLTLDSHITVNLIDSIHLDLHPAFVRPDKQFFIQAIGEIDGTGDLKSGFNIYAENNGNQYLIEIEAIEDRIESAAIYHHVLNLTPDESEWETVLKDITTKDIEFDDIRFLRVLGGDAETADLCELKEHIKTETDTYDCLNKTMLFERNINPGDFKEKLKVSVEVIESTQEAGVSFYLGFSLHPSTISLLGH